jgi:hypothetical protein
MSMVVLRISDYLHLRFIESLPINIPVHIIPANHSWQFYAAEHHCTTSCKTPPPRIDRRPHIRPDPAGGAGTPRLIGTSSSGRTGHMISQAGG